MCRWQPQRCLRVGVLPIFWPRNRNASEFEKAPGKEPCCLCKNGLICSELMTAVPPVCSTEKSFCPVAPGSKRLLLSISQSHTLLLRSGTEEADGSTGPALLFLCGRGSRAGGGSTHHSDADNQGAAAQQRHRRTLQGPGGHAAKVGHGAELSA